MSSIDDLNPVPAQPEISEGNKTFSQKTYALYVWIRTKLVPAMVDLRNLIINSVTGAFTGVSTSTVTITDTGEVSFDTNAGLSFKPGTPARLASVADPRNYIDGITKTYDAATGAFVLYAQAKSGAGTLSNWSLTIIPSGGGLAGLGSNTFTGAQYVPDEAYDPSGWDGDLSVPTKKSVRDKIEALISGLTQKATQVESIAGADDTKFMTALRVRDSINTFSLIKHQVVALAGAAAYDISIPAGVFRVHINMTGVGTNGSSAVIFQLSSGGSVVTSGYVASGSINNGSAVGATGYSIGFGLTNGKTGSDTFYGDFMVSRVITSNTYVANHVVCRSGSAAGFGGGAINLSGSLDKIRLTTQNGTDLLNAGTISIYLEF